MTSHMVCVGHGKKRGYKGLRTTLCLLVLIKGGCIRDRGYVFIVSPDNRRGMRVDGSHGVCWF